MDTVMHLYLHHYSWSEIVTCVDAKQPTSVSAAKPSPPAKAPTAKPVESVKKISPLKVMDITAKQTCKHKGCGNIFTEMENHDTACNYHPGPAIFHDRQRGVGFSGI